jgi:hypothetical protein
MKNRKFIFSLLAIIFFGLVYGTIREMELLVKYQFAIQHSCNPIFADWNLGIPIENIFLLVDASICV